MAKYKLEGRADPTSLRDLQLAIYSLVRDNETSFALFLQKMDIQEITGDCMMVCHPQTDGTFLLGINFEHFNKLSKTAKKEMLKHVTLHIPFGHKSSRARRWIEQYGPELTELAQDLVINQLVGVDILAVEGVNLPTPEHYGLKRNLTTDKYIQELNEMASKQPEGGIPQPSGFSLPRPMKCPGKGGNNPNGFPEDESGFTKMDPSDSSNPKEQTDKDLDESSQKMINGVDDMLKSTGKKEGLKQQGFYPGECEEFIKSLEREAKISWATYLRRKEGKHRRTKRVITRRRPSRRCDEYYGRIRKMGVSCLVAVDTSGSMSHKELRCIQAEVKAMSQRKVYIQVVYVDDGIAKGPFEFKPGTRLEDFAGRGGTEFTPAFECYCNMKDQPDFMVYVTDGYGSVQKDYSHIDVLWVLTSTGMSENDFRQRIKFGDVAILDVEDEK